jgi:DNA/RNA non-specific endonuclease
MSARVSRWCIPSGECTLQRGARCYTVDRFGRTTNVRGRLGLHPGMTPQSARRQRDEGGTYRDPWDDGGHLVGKRFGGSGNVLNLFAQNRTVNRGRFNQFERDLQAKLLGGDRIDFSMNLTYSGNSSLRPTGVVVDYNVNGRAQRQREFGN